MTQSSTVLILGARGRFGQAAARAFARSGWKVIGQIRPTAKRLPIEGVTWVALDPSDTAALAAEASEASVVIHGLNPLYTHKAWRADALAMLEGSIRLAQMLKSTLLLPGNVYNFGDSMPAVLRVDTAQVSVGIKGRIRMAMEQRLQAATQEGNLQAVVIRAGDFFGSGTGAWLDQAIAKDLKRGRVTWPAGLDTATPWAYLPDLARTFVEVAERRERLTAFSRLHFAGHTVTGQQWVNVLTAVAKAQAWLPKGGTLRVNPMPWNLFRLAGPIVPTFAALAEMRYLWRTPHQLDNRELRTLIGKEPHTEFGVAVRQSLHDLGLIPNADASWA